MPKRLFCDFCGAPIYGTHVYNITKDENDRHHDYRGFRTEMCELCFTRFRIQVLETRAKVNECDPSTKPGTGDKDNCGCPDNNLVEF